jgi:septal ring factor EnvC (AmiA/AmiB activator)
MLKSGLVAAILLAAAPLQAQDIAGIEDCSRAKTPDKKAGCQQSNIDFLYRLIRKNDAATQARLREQDTKLREHDAKLAAANARVEELRAEIERLRSALDQLEKNAAKK